MTAQYGDWQIDEALKQNKGWRLFVWLFLDDSCYSDCKTYWDNKLEDGKYLKWAKSEFLQAWYWNGIRNTSNNLTHLIAVKVFGKNQFIKKVEKQNCECELYKNKYLGYVSLIRVYCCGVEISWGFMKNGKCFGPKVRKDDRVNNKQKRS